MPRSSLNPIRCFTGGYTSRYRIFSFVTFGLAINIAFAIVTGGQTLPKEIRGYKVHDERIRVLITTGPIEKAENTDAVIRLGTPELANISLTGLTVEFESEIKSTKRSASVDFVTFRDCKINGVPVDIEEYTSTIALQPNVSVKLPKPVRVHIGASSTARTAFRELIGSKKEWSIEGTVFVFGKFRSFGMNFKRVIPVKVVFVIPNPIGFNQ